MEFFGEAWPSGVCDDGTQVPTPTDATCLLCDDPILDGDRGSFLFNVAGYRSPVHRECSLRSGLGGIGHIRDHAYWCGKKRDPDGGLSYRESSLAVWRYYQNVMP